MELSEVLKFKLLVIAHTISVYSQVAASYSQIVAVQYLLGRTLTSVPFPSNGQLL